MNKRFIELYMDIAHRTSKMSRAVRLQVGSVIVKDTRIISMGWNGTPAGWDNNCEDELYQQDGSVGLKTKPEVLHAEMNALMKLARSVESGADASIFITHAPCLDCAKGIYQAGIQEVYYNQDYRDSDGIYFLHKCGIKVEKITKD
jgi:dCMP deaminase